MQVGDPNQADSFTYTLSDGQGGTDTATVSFTIVATNDAPVASDANIAATEDGVAVTTGILASDVDTDNDASTLTYNIVMPPAEGTANSNGDGTFTFDPGAAFQDLAAGETRQVTFTYTATDAHAAVSNTGTVTITVTGVNDAPTLDAISDPAAIDETAGLQTINLSGITTGGGESHPLSITATSNNTSVVLNPTVSYNPNDSTGSISYFAAGVNSGTATITVSVVDAGDDGILGNVDDITVDQSFVVTVEKNDTTSSAITTALIDGATVEYTGEINDHQNGLTDVDLYEINLTAGDLLTADLDAAFLDDASVLSGLNGYLRLFDASGNQLAFNNEAIDPNTSVQSSDPVLRFTASSTGIYYLGVSAGTNGSYDATLEDSGVAGTGGAYKLQLTLGDNQAPIAVDDAYTVNENSSATTLNLLANDSDPDGNNISFVTATQPLNGTVDWSIDEHTSALTLTYTPDTNFSGTDQFIYTIQDSNGFTDTATVTMTVQSDFVIGTTKTFSANKNNNLYVSASRGVLEGVDFLAGTTLSATLDTDVTNGTLILNANGSFVYVPNAGYTGTDQFTYKIFDNGIETSSGTVTINVVSLVPVDDSVDVSKNTTTYVGAAYPVAEGETAIPGVMDNDQFGTDASTQVELVTGPLHGTLILDSDGSFLYQPDDDYVGADSFTYQLVSGSETSATTGTVTIDVQNAIPQAVDDTYSIVHDTSLSALDLIDSETELPVTPPGVLSNDTDADGDFLESILVTSTTNGTLTFNSVGQFTYTPTAGFVGTDSFTYKVSDGVNESSIGTVTINVTNTVPVAVDDTYTTTHDQNFTAGLPDILGTGEMGEEIVLVAGIDSLIENDTDGDEDTLTVSVLTLPTNGTLAWEIDGSFTYTPNAGFSGTDQFTYQLSDGVSTSNTATVVINVTNDVPVANDDNFTFEHGSILYAFPPATDPEGGGAGGTEELPDNWIVANTVMSNDINPDDDPLEAILVTNVTSGTLSFSSDGSYTYTANANFVGTDSFTYQLTDGTQLSNIATVTFTVTNSTPVANNDNYQILQGKMLIGGEHNLFASDVGDQGLTVIRQSPLSNDTDANGDDLTATLLTTTTNGTLVFGADGLFTYTPNSGYIGTDTFTYQVSDGFSNSNIATVVIEMTNAAPVATDDSYTLQHDIKATFGNSVLNNDSDSDNQDLTAVLVAAPSNGTISFFGNGTFTYTPNAGFVGNDSFTYKVTDGTLESNIATVSLQVTNDIPTGSPESFDVANNGSLNVGGSGGRDSGVLANDGTSLDAITATLTSAPSNGTIDYFNPNGTFSYTPEAGFTGTVTFTYQVTDGISQSDDITVSINVGAEDPDAPSDALNEALDKVNETAAEYDQAVQDMGETLASLGQELAAAHNESQAVLEEEKKAAAAEFLAAMKVAEAAYQAEINAIEDTYKTATDANNANYEQAVAQAASDYNASQATINKTYKDAIEAANQTYNASIAASDLAFTTAAKQASDTYQTQLSSLDSTYDSAIAASNQAQKTAVDAANSTYKTAEQAAEATYLAAKAGAKAQYDADLATAQATLDAVLAANQNTIYNPGSADSDATYLTALGNALAGIQSALSSAAATYQAAVDQAINVYNNAITSAASDHADALVAADTKQAAAYAAADATYAATAAAEQATYEATVSAAATTRDALIQSAQDTYNSEESTLADTRDQEIQTAQGAYDAAVQAANDAYNTTRAAIDQQTATYIQGAKDAYDAAVTAAATAYHNTMGPLTEQYDKDIAAAKAIYDKAEAQAAYELHLAKNRFSPPHNMAALWAALLAVENTPGVSQETIWQTRKAYYTAEAHNLLEWAKWVDAKNNTYVAAERAAFVTYTTTVTPITSTFLTKKADENKKNADAKINADNVFNHDTADYQALAAVQKQQAFTTQQMALASAKKTFEDAKADAVYTYDLGVAAIQNTLDHDKITAETAYAHSEVDAAKAQQLALAAASEQLQLDYANADVDWVRDVAAADKAFAVASNNAYASAANAILSAQPAYINAVIAANASAVGIVASARAAAIISASGNDPGVTAVANAYAAYQTTQAALKATQLSIEALAQNLYAKNEVTAWMMAANAVAGQAELQANAAAAAGLAWVTDEAAAYRTLAEANINAAAAASHNEVDAVETFNRNEADKRMTAAMDSAEKNRDFSKAAAQADLDHSNTHWPAELMRFQNATNAGLTKTHTEIDKSIKKLKDDLAAEIKKMKTDVATNAGTINQPTTKDKQLAIKEAAKRGAQALVTAQYNFDVVSKKPLADFENFDGAIAIGFDYISPALDNTVNFMTGWADSLLFGHFSTIVGEDYLRYVDYQSNAYSGGRVVGVVHSFLIGGAAGNVAHAGWAYTAARVYSAAGTGVGIYDSASKWYNGETLDIWDYLNFAPAVGAILGRFTNGLGIFECFVGDTQVVLAEHAPGGFQAQVGLAAEEGEGIELHKAGAGVLVLIGIVGAGIQVARKRKKQSTSYSDLDRLFSTDEFDELMDATARQKEGTNSRFLDQHQTNPQFALMRSGTTKPKTDKKSSTLTMNPQQSLLTTSSSKMSSDQKETSMPDPRQPAPTKKSKISRLAGPISWLSMFCLLGALVFGIGSDKTDANAVTHVKPQMQVTDTPVKYKTTAIEDVNIGERLLGKNPIQDEVDEFVPDIIPSEWRLLHLTMHKANGKRLDIQFLRPLDWIKSNNAQLGATIDLDLPEFGAKGPAKVVLIDSCPLIKTGPGNIVTGKFIHESDGNLIDLKIEDQQELTTVTSNHRYWSANRQLFVEAGHLKPGEQVLTLAGLKQVISINPHADDKTVYNLEVQGEHVYLVGSLGTLVHNNYFNKTTGTGGFNPGKFSPAQREIVKANQRIENARENLRVLDVQRKKISGSKPQNAIDAQGFSEFTKERLNSIDDAIEELNRQIGIDSTLIDLLLPG
ncbi:Ig-like domain-containing protein [Gimesia aquarii]|uniref:Major cell-surface adhesin PAc n=1 Tax=Gimesia aquarii TaxID=2527964 RepID=A0A517VXD9_9PLAN|nr:Ig-like domain-containing protein [Gimesia aquarii]QDT97673.1 Major cell-surface adhesin PAc precursor [Gimesia aquarii]